MVRSKFLRKRGILYLTQHSEWVKVPLKETVQRVICRTTNRIFVGVPLCSSSFFGRSILSVALDQFLLQAGTRTIRI
jgi:hypothetical protein